MSGARLDKLVAALAALAAFGRAPFTVS